MIFKIRCSSYILRQKYWNIDFDEKRACVPYIIQNDGHTSWDRCHYDFGHYGGYGVENHKNYKARYWRL